MTILVTGPSSVGKSTFLKSEILPRGRPLVFGFQLATDELPDNALVHYNLLEPALVFGSDITSSSRREKYLSTPIFQKIAATPIEECIVLVTSIDELIARMRNRTVIEEHMNSTGYDSALWIKILNAVDLFWIYENLFEFLEERKIPYRVLFSGNGQFRQSDRVFTHLHLQGRHVDIPDSSLIESLIHHPDCHYQSVLLPGGQRTSSKGYEHVGAGRHLTFKKIFTGSLVGQSVLDIGCALGELLFGAERLGAVRLVGLDRHTGRYLAARQLGKALQSKAEFSFCSFPNLQTDETFDHVYALNVIHHIHDFQDFLSTAAKLTRRTLTLEFPTFHDKLFRSHCPLSEAEQNHFNTLPLIGISSKSVEQSFIYSPAAIRNLVLNEIGGFQRAELMSSPVEGRVIMIFSK